MKKSFINIACLNSDSFRSPPKEIIMRGKICDDRAVTNI